MMVEYEDLLGKQFKRGGAGQDGYDCYTLSREVCRRAGIVLPEKKSIEDLKERNDAINAGIEENYERLEKPEPLCIVTFKLRPPFVTHMGVMLDKKHFIHILKHKSVSVARLNHKYWRTKIEGFYRYIGKNDNGSKSV